MIFIKVLLWDTFNGMTFIDALQAGWIFSYHRVPYLKNISTGMSWNKVFSHTRESLFLIIQVLHGEQRKWMQSMGIRKLRLWVFDSHSSNHGKDELLRGWFYSLRSRQNGRLFADDVFKCIFLNENVLILIKISLKFIPKGPINNIPALVQIMAWRRPGDKPLSEPVMIIPLTHKCVTRPQWVNEKWKVMTSVSNFIISTSHNDRA